MQKKYLALYGAMECLHWMSYGFVYPVLALYLTETRHLSVQHVGVITAFFWMLQVALQVPTGLLADRYGRKRTYIAAALMSSVGLWLHGTFTAFGYFFISQLLYGAGRAAASGTLKAWVIEKVHAVDDKARARIAKIEQQGLGSGMLVGALFSGVIAVKTQNYVYPFFVGSILLITGSLCVWLCITETPRYGNTRASSQTQSLRALAAEATGIVQAAPQLRTLMLFGFFGSLSWGTIPHFWPLYMQRFFGEMAAALCPSLPAMLAPYCAPNGFAGYLDALSNIPWMLGPVVAFRLIQCGSRPLTLLAASVMLYLIGVGVFASSATSMTRALYGFMVINFAFCALIAVRDTIFNGLVPHHLRATMLSLFFMVGSLGMVIGNLCAGFTIARYGFPTAWIGTHAIFAVASIVLLRRLAAQQQ